MAAARRPTRPWRRAAGCSSDGAQGAVEPGLFEARLAGVQAVLHNQDDREHDLLDSDGDYQLEGGLTATVEHLSGELPVVCHSVYVDLVTKFDEQ